MPIVTSVRSATFATMFGISLLDWLVLAVYFIGVTGLGLWAYKKVKSSGDFFMGNRAFGKVLMVAQAFGVGTHTAQPVSVSGASYTNGLAGIWYQWLYMFATPFFWILSPVYRRLRYVTMADFFEGRYGKGLARLYAVVGILYFSMNMGVMLKGTGVTIEGITGGALPEAPTIFIATVLFTVYGLAGGIVAAVLTDVIQGILILVLSFLLLPFAVEAAGGLSAFHEGLPPEMFSLVAPSEVTLFFIVMAVVNGLVSVVVLPHNMVVGGSGKTEIACRTGWTYGTLLKRVATIGWAFTGVFAALLYPGLTMENRELAFGIASRSLLPVGFVGLMLAAVIAAVMSTCDAFMVHASALFTNNVYKPLINPNATEDQLLKVGRWSGLAIVASGVMFAFLFPSVISGITEVWKVTAYLGLAFWLGVSWRRANRWGAAGSAILMAGVSLYTDHVLGWSFPYQVAAYLPVGLVSIVLISRFTRPEPEGKLHEFYTLLDTPVGEEHRLVEAGIPIMLSGVSEKVRSKTAGQSRLEKLLSNAQGDDGLLVVDLFSMRGRFSWDRYKADIIGFALTSLIVLLLILLVMYLAGLGA